MTVCSVVNCPNTSRQKGLRFFKFPNELTRRKIWMTRSGLENDPGPSAKLCATHFQKDQMMNHRQLKRWAIPSVFLKDDASTVHKNSVNGETKTSSSTRRKSSRIAQQQAVIVNNEHVDPPKRLTKFRPIKQKPSEQSSNETNGPSNIEEKELITVYKSELINTNRTTKRIQIRPQPCIVYQPNLKSVQLKKPSFIKSVKPKPKTVLPTPTIEKESNSASPTKNETESKEEEICSEEVLEKEAYFLRKENEELELANDKLKQKIGDLERREVILAKDSESLTEDIEVFQTNNRGMVHVIYQFQKHNSRLCTKFTELQTERGILKEKIRGVKKQCREIIKVQTDNSENANSENPPNEFLGELQSILKPTIEYNNS